MAEYTKDEALAFIESMRLMLGERVGFQWLVGKLSLLTEYIESIAAENAQLNAYVDQAGTRGDFEKYRAAHPEASASEDAPSEAE